MGGVEEKQHLDAMPMRGVDQTGLNHRGPGHFGHQCGEEHGQAAYRLQPAGAAPARS